AFYTYAFAWGIDAGLLDRATYQPAAIRGWDAIVRAVQPDGMLGWVQQVGDRPDSVSARETQFYGAGAFLLAGTAMADLARKESN
ncbi:MAG: glycosyl hydrolase family 88, partial [Sphingomonadales bacterium]